MIDAKRIQVTMSETIANFNTTASDFTLTGAPGVNIGSITAQMVQWCNGVATSAM